MCQSCANGGKRCSTDTSQARRHRRKAQNATVSVQPVAPNKSFTQPEAYSFSSVDDAREPIARIKKMLHDAPLQDEAAQDQIDNAIEVQVTSIGLGLVALAEKRADLDMISYRKEYDSTTPELDEATVTYIDADEEYELAAEALQAWVMEHGEDHDKKNPEYLSLQSSKDLAASIALKANEAYEEAMKNDDARRAELQMAQAAKLTAEYRKVVAELRAVGGTVEYGSHSSPEAVEAINMTVGQHYPSEWIEASNARSDSMRVKVSTERAHYMDEAVQVDLSASEDKTHTVNSYDYFYAVPIPVNEIEATREALGDDATILPGRKLFLNDEECKIIQMPHQRIFDPEKDATADGLSPSEDGWHFGYYIEPSSQKLSNKKAWLKNSSKTNKVLRPEIVVPQVTAGADDEMYAKATSYHEFAHRVESVVANGAIMRQEEAWLRRRTTDPETGIREDTSYIYPVLPGMGILDVEIGRRGTFAHHYIGKEYVSNSHREVLSTGAESIFAGSFAALSGLDGKTKADPDHKAFTLGIFAIA